MEQTRHFIESQFENTLALLNSARADVAHDPERARKLSVAITHTETAQLWAKDALA